MSEKMSENNFVDILKPRNTQFGIIRFMTRSWVPKKTLVLDKNYSPQDLKDLVVNSVYMDTFLEAESVRCGVSIEKLKKEMLEYLDEMAFEKKLHVVRWMGIAFLKICFMMKIGVFVNEPAVLKLKASMGNNPVLFLPTHRSYADFCLMTYLCFHYDIDIPAVAAGMDFHSMAVVGQRMREMCAFYIRRTLVGAPLYAATLRQYVRAVVARHAAPIEFFLEGTRSRGNKSLRPRYGMLSMSLMPYFAREVCDVTVVPVSISYERLVEATLFAYEHLGVPKPKESTEGLLKSLQSLNDNFGNIYITVGEPISLNEFTSRDVRSGGEALKPVGLQAPSAEQAAAVQGLAERVVAAHQACAPVTLTALLAVVLMDCLLRNRSLHLDDVLKEVEWVRGVLSSLGARVLSGDARAALAVQRRLLALDARAHLRLVAAAHAPAHAHEHVRARMKGHALKAETMSTAVPIIELQTYVNPVLHLLVPPALLCLIAAAGPVARDECYKKYSLLRTCLRYEFFYVEKDEETTFNKAVEFCERSGVVAVDASGALAAGSDERLQYLLRWAPLPALTTLAHCADVMTETGRCGARRAARLAQARGEARAAHPYSLSLEAAAHCLRGLHAAGALRHADRDKEVTYETVPRVMLQCRELVSAVLPEISVDFGAENRAVMGSAQLASRL